MAMKCFHRFDDSYQHQSQFSRGSSASISSFPTASHASQAYIASPKDFKDTSWFLDSDATHHVANRGDSLTAKNVLWTWQINDWRWYRVAYYSC